MTVLHTPLRSPDMVGAPARPDVPGDKAREVAIKRCAIYTRKSSHEGLDQSLNSLHAQRQFCENYIASQAGEGWRVIETLYDDGGFSGGSLDRPAVRRLMADVEAGAVDIVVVYKIDRLSRSLVDFSSLLGRFEAHKVDFVAVTQAFNTTSSMGRLTLNVLLSFAQFERELASERIRDKAAAARAACRWQNGPRPYGYQVKDGFLIPDEHEAEVVRYAFSRYSQLGSTHLLAEDMTAKGYRNKSGREFNSYSVRRMLKNILYRGSLTFRGKPIPGIHEAIVSERLWIRAQDAIAYTLLRHKPLTRPMIPNPLKGRVFGADGILMSHDFGYNRYGGVYRYYIPCRRRHRVRYSKPGTRFRSEPFDAAVVAAISDFIPRNEKCALKLLAPELLQRLVKRIDIGEDELVILLKNGAIVTASITDDMRSKGYARKSSLAAEKMNT